MGNQHVCGKFDFLHDGLILSEWTVVAISRFSVHVHYVFRVCRHYKWILYMWILYTDWLKSCPQSVILLLYLCDVHWEWLLCKDMIVTLRELLFTVCQCHPTLFITPCWYRCIHSMPLMIHHGYNIVSMSKCITWLMYLCNWLVVFSFLIKATCKYIVYTAYCGMANLADCSPQWWPQDTRCAMCVWWPQDTRCAMCVPQCTSHMWYVPPLS